MDESTECMVDERDLDVLEKAEIPTTTVKIESTDKSTACIVDEENLDVLEKEEIPTTTVKIESMDQSTECMVDERNLDVLVKEKITTTAVKTESIDSDVQNLNGGLPDENDVDDPTLVSSSVNKNSALNKNTMCDDDDPIKVSNQIQSDDEKFLLRLTFKNSETFDELHTTISTCIRDALFQMKKSTVISVEKDAHTVNFMTVDGIEENIFMIDTLPTDAPNNTEIPDYKSGFEQVLMCATDTDADKSGGDDKLKSNCWNCGGDHNLRDCKQPRDSAQISKAKQIFMKQGTRAERYHLDLDQKFGHLVPGKISDELRHALGLKKRELPMYIYRMRLFGYPPGWLEDAKVSHSGLTLFNSENRPAPEPDTEEGEVDKVAYDPNKFINYPGFNAQFPEGTIDDTHFYKVPPMQYNHSRDGLIEALKGNLAKTYKRRKLKHFSEMASDAIVDQDDMDIDSDDNNDSPVLFPQPKPEPIESGHSDENSDSKDLNDLTIETTVKLNNEAQDKIVPEHLVDDEVSLSELESKHLELLHALADVSEIEADVQNVSVAEQNLDVMVDTNTSKDVETSSNKESPKANDSFSPENDNQIQSLQDVNSDSERTDDNDSDTSDIQSPSTPISTSLGRSRATHTGTPLLKQVSPYSQLPAGDKWSVGVSEVIDFENLPSATGTYQRLTGLIQKVRTVVKKINDDNEDEDL